jgi:hypothetical protein
MVSNPSHLTKPQLILLTLLPSRPIIRQKLIATKGANLGVNFEDFFIPFCNKLNLNWPYPQDQVLIPNPSATEGEDSVLMNPVFETHLRDLNNWSMGTIFRENFPHLIDESVTIRDAPLPRRRSN